MLLATLLSYVGFTALCLSMGKHYGELLRGKLSPSRSRFLRFFGWACLCVSCWAAIESTAWGMGLVQWFGVLMASALLLVFLIPFRPGLALILAAAGLLFSPVAAFNQLLI